MIVATSGSHDVENWTPWSDHVIMGLDVSRNNERWGLVIRHVTYPDGYDIDKKMGIDVPDVIPDMRIQMLGWWELHDVQITKNRVGTQISKNRPWDPKSRIRGPTPIFDIRGGPNFRSRGGSDFRHPGGGPKFVIRDPDFRHPGGGHFLGPGGGPFFGSQGGVHFLGPRGSIFDRFQDPSAVVIRISLGVRTPIFPWKMDPGYAEF